MRHSAHVIAKFRWKRELWLHLFPVCLIEETIYAEKKLKFVAEDCRRALQIREKIFCWRSTPCNILLLVTMFRSIRIITSFAFLSVRKGKLINQLHLRYWKKVQYYAKVSYTTTGTASVFRYFLYFPALESKYYSCLYLPRHLTWMISKSFAFWHN